MLDTLRHNCILKNYVGFIVPVLFLNIGCTQTRAMPRVWRWMHGCCFHMNLYCTMTFEIVGRQSGRGSCSRTR